MINPIFPAFSSSCGSVSRRKAVKQILGAAAVLGSPGVLLADASAPVIRITTESLAHIPEEFTGLSYESSQLSHAGFFNPANRTLIQFFRTLGDRGVLRLGGNMSEYTVWDPLEVSNDSVGSTEGPDPGYGTDRTFRIAPHAIDTLAGFLDATGWRLIYGLNLARGNVDAAVEEAKYVEKTMGHRLIAVQFGNEPDLFKHNDDANRKWTYQEFIARWNDFYQAIRAALPDVPIAGPDTSNPRWNAQFAEDTGHKTILATSHFYAEGPPTDPRMNIDYLLHPGERLQDYVGQALSVSKKSGLPYRMSEGNTCYAAGKAGVSDTFASALWVLDFMLTVAQSGATGVNLHGGGDGLYTPVAGSSAEGYTARPIYYGMLLFGQLLGSTLLHTHVDGNGANPATYAARSQTTLQVVVINRQAEEISHQLDLTQWRTGKSASVWRLESPSVTSTSGVTLAQAPVKPDGQFRPVSHESLRIDETFRVAPYSAILITVPISEKNL